jgi:hypothetical protein
MALYVGNPTFNGRELHHSTGRNPAAASRTESQEASTRADVGQEVSSSSLRPAGGGLTSRANFAKRQTAYKPQPVGFSC